MNSFFLDFVVVLWFPRRTTIPKRMATDFRRNLATSNVVIVSLNGLVGSDDVLEEESAENLTLL